MTEPGTVGERAGIEHSSPAEEPEEGIWPSAVLAFVRQEAAGMDPAHSHIYKAATLRRIKNAAWLAYDLMGVHLELHRRLGRGARTGRRAHAAEIRRLLENTNAANLVLAQAALVAAIGTLPPDEPRRDG